MCCQASSQLAGEVGKVTEFLESSRDRRRWAEDGVRGLQASLRATSKRAAEVKRGYEARCREEIQANHTYHQVSNTDKEENPSHLIILNIRAGVENEFP